MNCLRIACVACTLLLTGTGSAQVDGLWVVKSVLVGAEDKTPVARWFRLEKGRQFSGNGWQRHSVGSYSWNKKTSELTFQTENEPSDGFGAFKVARKGDVMTWTRNEEGVLVKVELEIASDLPKSTADKIKGLWDLASASRGGTDVLKQTDPDGKQFLFMRWDRMFVKQLMADEQIRGYWFINAHHPELKFISINNEHDPETWIVTFEGEKLVLTGTSEGVKDLALVYTRMADFPD